MATTLTPEQLAALYQQFQNGNYNLNDSGMAPTAVTYGDGSPSQLLGYTGNYSGLTPGSSYDLYGTNGDYAGQRQVENGGSVGDLLKTTISDLKTPALMGAAMYLGGQGLGALMGNGASLGGLGAEVDPMMYGGSGASTWGAGSAAGAAGAATGATSAAGGGYATLPDIADVPGLSSSVAGMSPIATTGGALSGLSSFLPSGASSLLGPAASILGAVAGSQGAKQTTSQTRDIPDWEKPYVLGQGGLLDSTNSLMRSQMGYVPQQAQQISNYGMGLLQQPMAQNGVSLFANRKI